MTRIRLPAIAGRQGAHECWTTMMPIRAYLQMTEVPDQDLTPEEKAQRDLSEGKAGKLVEYLLENPDERVLSAVTLLVNDWTFSDGQLELPLDPTRISIADGQHRRRGLELAVQTDPRLRDESIPATIFPAIDLDRARRIFVAINSATPVPSTIRTYYQPGDKQAVLDAARALPFAGLIEFVKPNPSPRSGKIWSLTALCRTRNATEAAWWAEILPALPGFSQVVAGNLSAKEVRERYVWAHGVGLEAIGRLHGRVNGAMLQGLREAVWHRDAPHWTGRATDGRRMMANSRSAMLIANYILSCLPGCELTGEEQAAEQALRGSL